MKTREDFLLDIRDVTKNYGETRALSGLNVQCRAGTVHTIFGENGSGKSTMVKVLSGIIKPDSGEIRFAGKTLTKFTPSAVQACGIMPVLQEVLVAPNRSVLENIFLGYDGLFRRKIPAGRRREVAQKALSQITHSNIDVHRLVGKLPLAQQQLVVIARALIRDPSVLILDESTSALDIEDQETLFHTIRQLISTGRIVIFISHRVDEILDISDFVTVLRNGQTVDTVKKSDLTVETLLKLAS